MTPVVELEAVSKHYGALKALDELSLSVGDGEVLGLLGHNGAGKSTTMKLLLGIISPTAGQLRVFGQSPTADDAQALRYQLGYLPESVSFYDLMSGHEVLLYFARLKGVGKQQCDELLHRVGLGNAAGRRVKTYSKGMRQRLGLAQALLGEPKLLLLDEPTAGLDPLATREFYQTIDELRRQGTTIILSSHVLAGIEQHIERAVILSNGKLRATGSLDELRRQAQLPLLIHVYGSWPEDSWQDLQSIATVEQITAGQISIQGRLEDKIELIRRVLEHPGISDFEICEPSLEALYSHFSSDQANREMR
ncbi:MAG: ABC transporter ATP-binding protein [Gammaproteobacteria bacterium]|nr:ABC transporter ATP-binding protein [Gammaproteobacteria bacterium]